MATRKKASVKKKATTKKKATAKKATAKKKATTKKRATTKKKATAKKATAKKATAPAPPASARIEPPELLDRCRPALGLMSVVLGRVVEEAAERCAAAGRADLAVELADAMPDALRGPVRLVAAAAGTGSVDRALDEIVAGASSVDGHQRDAYIGWALEATPRAGGHPKVGEVVALASELVESGFAQKRSGSLTAVLTARMRIGDPAGARELASRWLEAQRDISGFDRALRATRALGAFADDPKATLAVLDALGERSRRVAAVNAAGWASVVGEAWSTADLAELDRLCALPAKLGQALAAAGRVEEARALMFAEPEKLKPHDRAARHLALGEVDEAKAILAAPPFGDPTTRLRIELGVETIQEARARLHATGVPGFEDSVMAKARGLLNLVQNHAIPSGQLELAESILADVDQLFGSRKRSSYDKGVEGPTRVRSLAAHLELLGARGEVDEGRTLLWDALQGIKDLHKHARDADAKNRLTDSLVQCAVDGGQPDLALAAAKKITKSARPERATVVAASFLPSNPRGAFDAFEALASDDSARWLTRPPSQVGLTPFFVALWEAVVA